MQIAFIKYTGKTLTERVPCPLPGTSELILARHIRPTPLPPQITSRANWSP